MIHSINIFFTVIVLGMTAWTSSAAAAQGSVTIRTPDSDVNNRAGADPRAGLLTPLPSSGGLPPIYDALNGPTEAELEHRARARDYDKQLRLIRREYFSSSNNTKNLAGLEQVREFTDPASFRPMLEVFADSSDPVRMAILVHLAAQGEYGLAALAWSAIYFKDEKYAAFRNEATRRLVLASEDTVDQRGATSHTPGPVLQVLDTALRSPNHAVANNAGALAGALHAVETIPLLMFAQATEDPLPDDRGDLAWIAIQTQQVYVANVTPVVGDDAGAFQPVLGVVNEGTVLRVMDAVVVVYRTDIHDALVNMTTHDWGHSTAELGYNMKAWWQWYNNEYLPWRNERQARRELELRNTPDAPAPTDSQEH